MAVGNDSGAVQILWQTQGARESLTVPQRVFCAETIFRQVEVNCFVDSIVACDCYCCSVYNGECFTDNRPKQSVKRKEKHMDLNKITDLHNRRRDLELVAQRAKRHGYPLLVWPEDKLLLRVGDLASESYAGSHNQPVAWKRCEFERILFVMNDAALREAVQEGKAYTRVLGLGQFGGTAIAQYKVESK